MKRITLFLLTLMLISVCISKAKSQANMVIVESEIIAFDSLAESANITNAPQRLTLIIDVKKVIKGDEKNRYLKVIYEYFDDNKISLLTPLSKKNNWNFLLQRDENCDSNLKDEKYSKIYSIENQKEKGLMVRSKDLGKLKNIPESIKLPCYFLKTKGVLEAEK